MKDSFDSKIHKWSEDNKIEMSGYAYEDLISLFIQLIDEAKPNKSEYIAYNQGIREYGENLLILIKELNQRTGE